MVVNTHRVRINDFGNCMDNVTTGPDFGEHIFIANLDFLTVTGKCFHNFSELSSIKRNLDTATQFARTTIFHTSKRPVQKTVAKFNIVDYFKEPGNANQRVYFLAIVQAVNLDFVIVVNFAGSVF